MIIKESKLVEKIKRLYADIKVTYLKAKSSDFAAELQKLDRISAYTVLDYIRSTVEIIFNQPKESAESSSLSEKQLSSQHRKQEKYIRRLEEDLRNSQKVLF